MLVENSEAEDEMIHVVEEVVPDSTQQAAGVMFPAELSTTLCALGMIRHLRHCIVKPPTDESHFWKDIDTVQVIDITNNKKSLPVSLASLPGMHRKKETRSELM